MSKLCDFSRLSPIYDFLGSLLFFGSLHRSQLYFLDRLQRAENVLILGGGTGRFLVDALKTGKFTKVTYVDISQGMIEKAKKKVSHLGFADRVEFICGGIEAIPAMKYELVCTHYFLDCFNDNELRDLLSKLKFTLNEGGAWHFTDFYLDKSSSYIRRKFVAFLYFFFRVSCGLKVKQLADFKKAFREQGFECEEEKYFFIGLLRSGIYRV